MHIWAWVTFSTAIGFVLYTLFAYPLLLWAIARCFPRRVLKEFQPESVTVLLPVYNGERWIRQKLETIAGLDYPGGLVSTIVISDGSTDRTESIVEDLRFPNVTLLSIPKGGKAVAINRGLEMATGNIIFFTDVRQRLHTDCLKKLVSCFADSVVGAVCGELIILEGETLEEASVGLYWRIEKWIRKQLSNIGTLLVVTGCLYAIRRHLAEPIPAGALGDDIFMPQTILRKGYRVVFEEDAKAYDYPTTVDLEFQRKVRTLAGLYQYVGRHGLGPHRFHFFSYKVSRLLLPYALIAVAISSVFLPPPFRYLAIGGQAAFYVLAVMDRYIPDRMGIKRISSPARTFCVLMTASLWAARVLFVPSADLWKTTRVNTPKLS